MKFFRKRIVNLIKMFFQDFMCKRTFEFLAEAARAI